MTIALDLFAGVGWGVACQRLGIDELGIDNDDHVVATRDHAGMTTIGRDVLEVIRGDADAPEHDILIASPPCQPFSLAGRGDGRLVSGRIAEFIHHRKFESADATLSFVEEVGERAGLVVTPLWYVAQFRPRAVLFEQVETVLGLWQYAAIALRELGYSARAFTVKAEQFGVPQTRRRAILMAWDERTDARPLAPTHSVYHQKKPGFIDPGLQRWVSMYEALGRTEALMSNYGTNGNARNRGLRYPDQPAPTLTSKGGRNKWIPWGFTSRPALTVTGHGLVTRHPTGQKIAVDRAIQSGDFVPRPPYTAETAPREDYVEREDGYLSLSAKYHPDAVNMVPVEAAVLQTFPADFWFSGPSSRQFLTIGNAVPPLLAEHLIQSIITPN